MHDVLIVGGGPVGMGLAIELGQRGVDVAVLERHRDPQPVPKGQNLTQRTMEHMRAWGVEDVIRAAKTIPAGVGLGGLTAYGTLFSGLHYDWFKRAAVGRYYAATNERLPQYATEAVLRARAADLPAVTLRYGETGKDVAQKAESATVTTEAGETISARYVVACDGSHSRLRDAAGIPQTTRDHARLMALVVFRSPAFFAALQDHFPDKQFYNVLHPDLDGYWMFFGMVDWGQTIFFHAPVPPGTDRATFDASALVTRAAGRAFDMEIEHVGFWDLRIAHADTYRAGRVFVAGDAAHSHPPYGGYGINTGFEDARNLGWKLAAALDGTGGAALLDSYDAERRPVFQSTARDFIERFIKDDRAFLARHDPGRDRAGFDAVWAARAEGGDNSGVAEFAPHYAGSPIIRGTADETPSARDWHDTIARAGRHLSPFSDASGPIWDRLGDGFTLLCAEADPSGFVTAARDLGLPLDVVQSDAAMIESCGAPLVLLRPDSFVAWAGEEDGDASAILRQATGRPAT